MGKHKEKKSKKHKKDKKHKKKERRCSSSSSGSSPDRWVEKEQSPVSKSEITYKDLKETERDEWMSLPTNFASTSNVDRRREREANKRLEKEKEAYNPRESVRELNPFWKDGGDGLPQFKKPSDDILDTYYKPRHDSVRTGSSNWRKKPSTHTHERENYHESIDVPVQQIQAHNSQISEQNPQAEILSESELNVLAAKLVKAEIMGNTALIAELKEKLEDAKTARLNNPTPSNTHEQEFILTQTDSKGYSRPLKLQSEYGEYSGGKRKKQKVETHADGQRVRYFPDDDKYSLQQMFENEKYSSVEDSNKHFMQLAGKIRKNDDLDEVFADNIRRKESDSVVDKRNKDKAITEHQQTSEALDNCSTCLQSDKMLKHLMVSMSDAVYLSLPHHEPLTKGHCLLVPIRHASCSTQLDENEWSEMLNFRRALTKMFSLRNEDVIFFETAMFLHRHPHMALQCVPVPKEQGDMAPIYFKKAIDESEQEWALNKKLVSLAGRDVRRAIPKGLPYFSVSFGMDEGFAHVIEDQRVFPTNFAQEIIGGILDLHHSKWRKPKPQKFEEQKQRVLEFSKEWTQYDCTVN